jgi:(p)ppGpp synthase/HD superfamily hydrolase
MANDLRVIFVKLADRIHNIQTLHYHPKEEKRRRIALETMKIYVPIAKKL